MKKQLGIEDAISKNSLEPKDILNVVFKMTDYLNFQWNFYVVVTIAITGWLYSSPMDSWNWQKKLLTSIAYILTSLMSLMILDRTYRFLVGALEELSYSAEELQFRSDNFRTSFKEVRPVNKKISITLHIIGNFVVLSAIWMKGRYF